MRTTCELSPPGNARVAVNSRGFRGSIEWTWRTGPTTLGVNPASTDDIGLCLFDGTGRRFVRAVAPAGAGWTANGAGFLYRNKSGAPQGLTRMTLDTRRLRIVGSGAYLAGLPTPAAAQLPPVVVQVHGSNGTCFSASYSASTVTTGSLG